MMNLICYLGHLFAYYSFVHYMQLSHKLTNIEALKYVVR